MTGGDFDDFFEFWMELSTKLDALFELKKGGRERDEASVG
jgi:hypothetical protein